LVIPKNNKNIGLIKTSKHMVKFMHRELMRTIKIAMVVACLYVSFSCNKNFTPQLVMVVCPLLCCERMGNDFNFDILGPCLKKIGSDNLTRVSWRHRQLKGIC
jgi:hypothetical protein